MAFYGSRVWGCVASGAVILSFAIGCSAEDSGGSGGRVPAFPGVPTAGTGAFAGSSAGPGPSGAAGSGSFGNPTVMVPSIGGTAGSTGMGGSMCRQATVQFVVDGSGSMCEPFGSGSRWSELRRALLDPMMGLIPRLQGRAKFGMMIYDGSISPDLLAMAPPTTMGSGCSGGGSFGRLDAMECMGLVNVPARLDNAGMIGQMFPMTELGGSTPTDLAMKRAVDDLIALQPGLDLNLYPQYIILATDGAPNSICVGGLGGDGTMQQANVIAEVTRAYQARITTFVISLAGMDAALQAHLEMVADAGNPADPNARAYSPAQPEELVQTLVTVLGQALGCNVE